MYRIIISLFLSYTSLSFANSGVMFEQGFGAAGDFVFTTVAGGANTCTLTAGTPIALRYAVCAASPCSTATFKVTANANVGSMTLLAGHTYHLSASAINSLAENYANNLGTNATNVQIIQLYCGNAGLNANISNSGMYSASCTSTTCTATSGPLTVTFP